MIRVNFNVIQMVPHGDQARCKLFVRPEGWRRAAHKFEASWDRMVGRWLHQRRSARRGNGLLAKYRERRSYVKKTMS
jgi:hypothetical protein